MERTANSPEIAPKTRWFKARRYGFGWTPITWQGWAITLSYTVLVISSAINFTRIAGSSPEELGSSVSSDFLVARFLIWIVVLTISMLWICYKTGDVPSWHWGDK